MAFTIFAEARFVISSCPLFTTFSLYINTIQIQSGLSRLAAKHAHAHYKYPDFVRHDNSQNHRAEKLWIAGNFIFGITVEW
jgi:hypothetical protein